jgi:hypothetical protein
MSQVSRRLFRFPPSLALGAALAMMLSACGGGGNESGPADTIQLSEDSVTVTSQTPDCPAGPGPTTYVFGGQPPYTIYNPLPHGMTIDKTSVADAGEGFTITFLGTCMTDLAVTIEDDMGRLATLSVTAANTPASSAAF